MTGKVSDAFIKRGCLRYIRKLSEAAKAEMGSSVLMISVKRTAENPFLYFIVQPLILKLGKHPG